VCVCVCVCVHTRAYLRMCTESAPQSACMYVYVYTDVLRDGYVSGHLGVYSMGVSLWRVCGFMRVGGPRASARGVSSPVSRDSIPSSVDALRPVLVRYEGLCESIYTYHIRARAFTCVRRTHTHRHTHAHTREGERVREGEKRDDG